MFISKRFLLKAITLFLSLFITIVVRAENEAETGSIKGTVITNDNKPAAMVTVALKGTKKLTLTTDDGSFIIRNVQPGSYEIEVSLVGYQTVTQTVTVEKNRTATIDFQLKLSDKELQEVIVKTGVKSYKANKISPTQRKQTPILEMSQNIQVVTNKALQDQQVISMS